MTHDDETISNRSNNVYLNDFASTPSRRRFLQQAAAAAFIAGAPMVVRDSWGLAHAAPPPSAGEVGEITFKSVGVTTADTVTVPDGYTARVLYAWGEPVSNGPAFKQDASNTADEQAQQAGMHHDGMHYFPFVEGGAFGILSLSSTHGLLVMNHEYVDDGLLHVGGQTPWTAEKVKKAQNAHGVSVIEIEQRGGSWQIVRPSTFARRVTAASPIAVSGPAAGHALLKTAADPTGMMVLGTVNNCAHGFTPWGTYLACEENFNGYFINTSTIPADQARYGIARTDFGYRWSEFDARFDAAAHPNEPNRFGWVVEIDPWDPSRMPVKRTALGRTKHEGATPSMGPDGRLVVYLGDDERFEYIYKFVSRDAIDRDSREANRNLLDNGTLYVARFNADGTGAWLPLVQGQGALTSANGFPDQATVCVRTRQAADAVGATKMDRPEWIAVHPTNRDVYVTLTNNSLRGTTGRAPADAPNPRNVNVFGHILRFAEAGSDPAALTFEWNIFAKCGDPSLGDPNKAGDLKGDILGSPDGAWFDQRGVLWVQTDISTSTLNTGDYKNIGNNQMHAFDPKTGIGKRFFVGPKGCEVTGVVATPDHKSMFVNIQHPGEPSSERSDPANPKAISSWPDGAAGGRPRAGTVVITKNDGGLIGT